MTGDGDRDGPGDLHPDEREDRPGLDFEAAFAAIVADYATPAPPGPGPWPAAEDVGPDEPSADAAAGASAPSPEADGADAARGRAIRRGPRHRLPDGGTGGGGYELGGGFDPEEPDDEHGRFVPPEPPPISSTDLTSRLAWLGVIGGPLFLLIAALIWRTLPTLVVIAALAAFIGGFITLVARLPRDRADGPDDGAVV
ncbi:MAG TPA: hypothetical protein VMT69_03400 [Kineosporiaceae bacterium]|nr:hypothetical protein [Kineosporiaceae bacterium]